MEIILIDFYKKGEHTIKNLRQKFVSFVSVSGVGWLIDFSIYLILINRNVSIGAASFISAIPAVTFVFIISIKKTFEKKESKIKLKYKYIIYIVYQILVMLSVAFIAQMLLNVYNTEPLSQCEFLHKNIKIVIKIFITPITMVLNFIVMKTLVEKT